MSNETLAAIKSGSPDIMVVINAADLKNVVADMYRDNERNTREQIAAHRERPTMTREAAAKALNVTLSTLWRWAKDGYLVPVKVGAKVLYRATDIDRMLEKSRP